jgi:hypothetical protein
VGVFFDIIFREYIRIPLPRKGFFCYHWIALARCWAARCLQNNYRFDMSNTINAILIDRMYAMALKALRRKTTLLQYCTRYDREMGASFKGDTVVLPKPHVFQDADVGDVTPSNVLPAPTDITPGNSTVTLNNWKKVSYGLTDKEVSFLQDGTFSNQFDAAIDALARVIVKSVWENYLGIYNAVGTAGTTPFASNVTIVGQARKLLNQAGVPMTNRAMVLGFDADANAINLAIFQQYLQAGNTDALQEGTIKRAVGFDWTLDAYTPTFTGGTLSNGTTKAALINGAVTAGAKTMNIDSGTLTGTLVPGDIFTVGTATQQYVVTNSTTAAANAIAGVTFEPASLGFADNATVTFVANHALAAMALHPEAIGFASKPLDNVMFEGGNMIRQISDPISGLTLCLEMTRQYKQTVAEFSCLWGSTLMRPECAVRILG